MYRLATVFQPLQLQSLTRNSLFRKETGLERFIPGSLAETMKRKELRKLLTHFIKLNSNLVNSSSGSSSGDATEGNQQQQQQQPKHLTALQAKLHYLRIIAELPSYGAKCFSTNISVSTETKKTSLLFGTEIIEYFLLQDSNIETVILISPKFGVSQINSLRNSVVSTEIIRTLILFHI